MYATHSQHESVTFLIDKTNILSCSKLNNHSSTSCRVELFVTTHIAQIYPT